VSSIISKTRRVFSKDFKAKDVLEALKEKVPLKHEPKSWTI
jgi:hypothetical protein